MGIGEGERYTMESDIINYRKITTLPNGLHVDGALANAADRDGLLAMFTCATKDDLQYFRDDVTDRDVGFVVGRTRGCEARDPARGRSRRAHCRPGRRCIVGAATTGTWPRCASLSAASFAGAAWARRSSRASWMWPSSSACTIFLRWPSAPSRKTCARSRGWAFAPKGILHDRFMDAEGNTYDMIEMALAPQTRSGVLIRETCNVYAHA